MIPALNASKIYSTLGNSNSLVPLALKDCANSIGLTAASYVTGDSVEGTDRFIDEFGTQAIWLFGIPAYKKLLDLGLFKNLGYDHNIDVRVLKNQDILKKAKQYAPTKEIKDAIVKVAENQKTFKGISFGKFVASTLLTILSYWGLTKFRHNHTEKHIKELYLKEHGLEDTKEPNKEEGKTSTQTKLSNVPKAFDSVHFNGQKTKQPSFKGIQDFMFSPTKNLMIVDGAISAERIFESRNPQDQIGYIVKEGGFWLFMYFAGQKIQEHFEKAAEKKHNKSIDLDARVIESDDLKNALKNNTLLESLERFTPTGKDVDIYDFICNSYNKDNIVVKMAKKSDLIKVIDPKNLDSKVDTRSYIDLKEVKAVRTKLEKLYNQFNLHKTKNADKTEEQALDSFLNEVRKLKRSSIRKNIVSCIAVLGIVVPGVMVALRYFDKENKGFKVKEEIEKKLAQEMANKK